MVPTCRPGFSSASVGLSFDHEFVGSGFETVDGGLGQEGVSHLAEPFDGFSVGGDHGGCGPVALDDELVDICGVEVVEGLEGEVVKQQKVDADELSHLGVVAVVQA